MTISKREDEVTDFDLPRLFYSLEDLPLNDMLFEVEEEINACSALSFEDSTQKFRQTDYIRKLQRLRTFLRTGRVPENMMPKEKKGYEGVARKLQSAGIYRESILEILGQAAERRAKERRAQDRRRSSDDYKGPERRQTNLRSRKERRKSK